MLAIPADISFVFGKNSDIGEIDQVIFTLACFDLLIFFEKCLLFCRVLFAGNMRRFFAGKPKAMQQIRNATERVAYSVLFMDKAITALTRAA